MNIDDDLIQPWVSFTGVVRGDRPIRNTATLHFQDTQFDKLSQFAPKARLCTMGLGTTSRRDQTRDQR